MHKKQKGFASIVIALIFLIAAGAGIAGYYLLVKDRLQKKEINQTSSDNSQSQVPVISQNWKTYTSKELGFEFKYPSEYDNFPDCKIKVNDKMVQLSLITIKVLDQGGLSLTEYVSKDKGILTTGLTNNAWNQENISVGGLNGIKVTWNYGSRYSMMIYLLKDSKIYLISFDAGLGCSEQVTSELDVFTQIPFTFKFLK